MTESIAGIYARMAVAVPFFDDLNAYPDTVPAVLMTDPSGWQLASPIRPSGGGVRTAE
ncbi:hypothetical protein GCM10020255_067290 [Rhodococcus baikonurensis]